MRANLSSQISLTHISKKLYQTEDVLERSRLTRMELLRTHICASAQEGAKTVAGQIGAVIREKQERHERAVLSLEASRGMAGIFAELVRLHKEEGLSFRNVVLFNLFEYYPLIDNRQGCFGQLKAQLLDEVDIMSENVFTIDGTQKESDILKSCMDYEQKLQEMGGVDFQLIGIGRGGSVGFNEAGTLFNSPTRLVILDNVAKNDAVDLFGSVDQVPMGAVTMGLGTILRAKRVVMVAWGEDMSAQVYAAVERQHDPSCPASALQLHPKEEVVLDLSAASQLTRLKCPWLLTSCEWDDQLARRAIVWLCQQTGKPILRLTNKDYDENGLGELVALYGSADDCNGKIFNDLQHTITGWPVGKPKADDGDRPERATPFPKRVLIFSPHPDDDVISMGGTFARLVKQGYDVHVAYETSGCIAVRDDVVVRFLDFVKGFGQMHDPENKVIEEKCDEYTHYLLNEKTGDRDTRELLDLKALIRRCEATAACRYIGLPLSHIHFLNLPFYETGTIKKKDLSQRDVDLVKQVLIEVKPDEMFVAGDLADPHGTHKVCLDAVLAAIDELKDTEEWLHKCRIWMYRGVWMEWDIDLIELAVPMSPEELRFKRNAILKHQSQMESAMFMGDDERPFWQRAEDRNRATAELYARLGLANYEAVEAFVQYHVL